MLWLHNKFIRARFFPEFMIKKTLSKNWVHPNPCFNDKLISLVKLVFISILQTVILLTLIGRYSRHLRIHPGHRHWYWCYENISNKITIQECISVIIVDFTHEETIKILVVCFSPMVIIFTFFNTWWRWASMFAARIVPN